MVVEMVAATTEEELQNVGSAKQVATPNIEETPT